MYGKTYMGIERSAFLIDKDGTIYQLVSLRYICRHTVGLNDRAIGIEHAGFASQSSFPNGQIEASAKLTCDITRDHGVDIRQVLENLEARAAVPGDHLGIVERIGCCAHWWPPKARRNLTRASAARTPCRRKRRPFRPALGNAIDGTRPTISPTRPGGGSSIWSSTARCACAWRR